MEWEEYGKKFKLGKGPVFEKRVLTSLARKMPKNVGHSAIHPRSSFANAGKAWELFLTSTIWVVVCFLHDFGPWMFSPIIRNPSWALSLSNGWKFVVCEFRFWICCVFLPHVDSRSSFSRVWELHFCDVLVVGFLPQCFLFLFQCCQTEKSFFCFLLI